MFKYRHQKIKIIIILIAEPQKILSNFVILISNRNTQRIKEKYSLAEHILCDKVESSIINN